MAILEISVNRLAEGGGGSTTVAIFRISDDGTSEPVLINPPDIVTMASLRRCLDYLDAMALIARGEKPSEAT
jgi:hypothetical protein